MKKITVESLLKFNPCYSVANMQLLDPDNRGLTPLEILDLPIPEKDRIWVLTRPEVLFKEQLVRFAVSCAERKLQIEDLKKILSEES